MAGIGVASSYLIDSTALPQGRPAQSPLHVLVPTSLQHMTIVARQARPLSADRPLRGLHGAVVHPPRPQLNAALSGDRHRSRQAPFTLDGEAVLCGPDGVTVFVTATPRARHASSAARVIPLIGQLGVQVVMCSFTGGDIESCSRI